MIKTRNTIIATGLLICLISRYGYAQVDPPVKYDDNIKVNYVRSWVATAPETDPAVLITRPLKDVKQTTQYFDGLGRPWQTVMKQGSYGTNGSASDLVIPLFYDAFGREGYKYLPCPANTAGGNTFISDGGFKLNPFEQQANFYSDPNGVLKDQGETYYYGKTNFEPSPLNRVLSTYAPGNNWVGSESAANASDRHGVHTKYCFNSAVDEVRIWNVIDNGTIGQFGTYATGAAYPAGQLNKEIIVDEQGKQIVEIKDKNENVILKKVQLTAASDDGSGSNHSGWLCTYYIYDDANLLRAVIQPRGVELLPSSGWQLTSDLLNEQCFRYEYDQRQRVIVKQTPGVQAVYLVYDARDRLVLTQDANLRVSSKWMFTKYDRLDRPILTGIYTDGAHTGQQGMQGYLNSSSLTLYENYQTAAFPLYSMNQSFPIVAFSDVLTVTYYDDYSWAGWYGAYASKDNTFDSYFSTSASVYPYPQPLNQSAHTKGLVTGVWQNAGPGLLTSSFYDDKGRVIQTRSFNFSSGVDVATTQYNFSGEPLQTVLRHEKAGNSSQTSLMLSRMTYDDLGRVIKTEKKIGHSAIGGGVLPSDWTVTAENEYNTLGELRTKKIGRKKDAAGSYTADALQTLTLDYNIKGWLLGTNRNYLSTQGAGTDGTLFGFELGYDKTSNKASHNFSQGMYNGNIAGVLWKSAGDGVRRQYDLSYDAANRLLKGDFTQYNDQDNLWNNSKVNFSVKMGDGSDPNSAYDANGNIKRMQQWGLELAGSTQIDDLQYSYYNNGNKLAAVAEQGTGTIDHKLGDFTDKHTGSNDYGYDANGNLVTDLNKRLNGSTGLDLTSGGAITYNYLNLPVQVMVKDDNGNSKGSISYTYDAMGNKLQKTTAETNATVVYNGASYTSNIITTTTYLGSFVYESKAYSHASLAALQYTDKLQFTGQEEGRVRGLYANTASPNTLTGFAYDYFLKDHLGNVRMLLTEEQQQDIYPAVTLEGDINTNGAPNAIYQEKNYYTIDPAKVVNKSDATGIPDYLNNNGIANPNPNSATTANSGKLYKLQASGTAGVTGLGITLKVMSGDRVNIFGKSYYFDNNSGNTNQSVPVLDILTGLLGSGTGVAAGKGVTAGGLGGVPDIANAFNVFLGDPNRNNNGGSSVPKAYINWILLDQNFNFVSGSFSRVGAANAIKDHYNDAQLQNIPVTRNGYLYVYCSNESPVRVFFDNLQVVHTRGPILEETHYYPFGLSMAGISDRTLKTQYSPNKFWYNGKELQNHEFSDGSGLEEYDYGARHYDPQIGRWAVIDPMAYASKRWSPYNYVYDNPLRLIDPDGMLAVGADGLTNDQWLDVSRPGADKDLSKKYQEENRTQSTDKESNNSDGDGPTGETQAGFSPLKKSDLAAYYLQTHGIQGTDNDLGGALEKIFNDYVLNDVTLNTIYEIRMNREKSYGDRNTVPDFKGNVFIYVVDGQGRTTTLKIGDASWFELKAKEGGLYLSSNIGQVQGHIDNLSREYAFLSQKYKAQKFKPRLYLLTTADVGFSPGISNYAKFKNVSYQHIQAQYRKVNGKWEFNFTYAVGGTSD